MLFVDRLGDVQLVWRGRLEERACEGAPAAPAPPVGDARWKLVAFDECFVGLTGPAARLGFDQNRAFVGVLHQLAPWFSVEGGYVNVGSERVLPTLPCRPPST